MGTEKRKYKMKNIKYHKALAERLKNRIVKKYDLSDYVKTLKVKKINRGRSIYKSGFISIPKWSIENKRYFVYYVLHELTHFIIYKKEKEKILPDNVNTHGIEFKSIEKDLLYNYGIKVIYKKPYPKYLTDRQGKIICEEHGKKYKG